MVEEPLMDQRASMPVDWARLAAPFHPEAIEWRLQRAGEKNGRIWAICVPYITNRAIQRRLDEVVGPENWKNEFHPGPDGGVLCGISIRVNGEWITKYDGAENTDIESVRGGLSDAMKRAAVQWSISRYLYGLTEAFATVHENGKYRGKTKDGKPFRWDPPELPEWALPRRENKAEQEHAALLEYIKSVGAAMDETAEIRVAGALRNAKAYIRDNWAAMKEQHRIARIVADAIADATGTPFDSST